MGHFLSQLSHLLLLVAITHAADLTGRDYWNSVLPKTPMPNTITELLASGKQNPGKLDHSRIIGSEDVFQHYGEEASETVVGLGKLNPRKLDHSRIVGSEDVFQHYGKEASETQLHNIDLNVAIFFLEKDLHSGKKMTLQFTKTTSNAPDFIPRSEANKLPFSSSKFSEILDHFKITKNSAEADVMKRTLNDCEKIDIDGEKKYCATSLESMVDFVTSSLKTHDVRPLTTNVKSPNAPKQEYMVIKSKIMPGSELVSCHMEHYAYAVFYCHVAKPTKTYMVNLVGKDGDRVAAIAVCHMDTSSWNPKYLAFQLLKVQPGTVPICHFLPENAVTWARAI